MHFTDSPYTKIYFYITGMMGASLNFSLFIVLICCKNTIGDAYRNLMAVYVAASCAYSMYNFFVQPVILINESGWLLYASGFRNLMDPLSGSVITSSFCTLASILIASLAFSYMLRYLTICRNEGALFIRQHIMGSFNVVLTVFLTAGVAATGFFYLLPNQITNSAFGRSFYEEFGVRIEDASYFGCITYLNGTMYPIFMVTFGIRAGICVFSTLVIIFGGVGIIFHLRRQVDIMSDCAPFLKRQRRLFSLLLLQSFTPIVTFYFPLAISFIAAMLQCNCPVFCKILSILLPISTIIDPILIYLNVSQYRRYLYYKLRCQKVEVVRRYAALPAMANGHIAE